MRSDGHLRFLGRYKDMLKIGGENVDPMEVEGFLMSHPAIRMAAVVGVPDARLSEVAVAFVQVEPGSKLTEREVIEHCRGRVASFKTPRHIAFVDEFPMTSTGKIQKVKLRERARSEWPTRRGDATTATGRPIMSSYNVISADSHIVEPPDLYESRIEPKFRSRAPRIERHRTRTGQEYDAWYLDGVRVGTIGSVIQAGRRFEDPGSIDFLGVWEDVRKAAYEPHAMLEELEADGVWGACLQPSQGLFWYRLPDSELLSALCRAYNAWITDFCRAAPSRFKGIGMLNVDDVDDACQELERCAEQGLAGPSSRSTRSPSGHTAMPATTASGGRPRIWRCRCCCTSRPCGAAFPAPSSRSTSTSSPRPGSRTATTGCATP